MSVNAGDTAWVLASSALVLLMTPALASGSLAISAFVVTNTAGAMGALTWMTLSWWLEGKPSVVGAASGAVVGLAAVTLASGFVEPMGAAQNQAGGGGARRHEGQSS